VLSCLSGVAKVAARLRHLVFNLWWAERPVVFLTCVPQCWQVIVILLLESLFIDCLSISDLHLSWSEVCLEISLLFWRFLALSRIMRRYLSKKLWLWASVLAIFALYKLLNVFNIFSGGARPKTLVGIFFSYLLETIGRNFLPT